MLIDHKAQQWGAGLYAVVYAGACDTNGMRDGLLGAVKPARNRMAGCCVDKTTQAL